jgi:hypothetical protein
VRAVGAQVESVPVAFQLPDPDDQPFLEAAIVGLADVIITGNLRHFPDDCGVRVMQAGPFLAFRQ